MFQIIRLQPNLKRLRRKAPIAHGDKTLPTGSQHPRNLLEDFLRLIQVIHAHHTRHLIEALILKWKLWLIIQIAHNIRRELFVLAQFVIVHAESNHVPSLKILGIMADPRRANIEDVVPLLQVFGVVLGEGAACRVIDVEDETRLVVEDLVGGFVLTFEVGWREGPFWWEFWVFEDSLGEFFHGGGG